MDHKWRQLILVVNFLFGWRVNEIPNKTFILDSHRPSICSLERHFFGPARPAVISRTSDASGRGPPDLRSMLPTPV
jgi:hypothetical protein